MVPFRDLVFVLLCKEVVLNWSFDVFEQVGVSGCSVVAHVRVARVVGVIQVNNLRLLVLGRVAGVSELGLGEGSGQRDLVLN